MGEDVVVGAVAACGDVSLFGLWRRIGMSGGGRKSQNQGQHQHQSQKQRAGVSVPRERFHASRFHQTEARLNPKQLGEIAEAEFIAKGVGFGLWRLSLGETARVMTLS